LFSGTTPTVWFATSDGIGATDNIWLYRTHFHRETAFSKPGRYEIDVVISGYLDGNGNNALDATDVYVESGIKTMVFGVDFPAQWRQENFGSTAAAGNAASGADPELDGISNRLEYAFGLNPSASSTTPLSLTPGGAVLERGLPIVSGNYAMFLRRRDYQAAGLTYTPQVSTDLTTWQPVTATPEVIGSDAEMDLVRVPLPVAAGDRQFFNVSVTMP
jgi:surface-anchored protein